MADNDPLDLLISEADPARAITSSRIEEALDSIGTQITATPVDVRERGGAARTRRIAGTVGFAAVLAATAPAAADWVAARTGWFGEPATSTEEDGTEWLRLDSPAIGEVVALNVRSLDLELPPGVTSTEVVAAVTSRVARDAGDGPQLMQEGAVRSMIGWDVACRWGWIWLESSDAADRQRIAAIADRLQALPAGLQPDDDMLAQQIRVNCPVDTRR